VISAQGEAPALREARQSKNEAILLLLGKLALHYWRPNFTPELARLLYADYVVDLAPFPMPSIAAAIAAFRSNGANRFFPTTGQLVDFILGKGELERLNPGAPDRATTLVRAKRDLMEQANAEVQRVAGKIVAPAQRLAVGAPHTEAA
jgi:hypothetical protein